MTTQKRTDLSHLAGRAAHERGHELRLATLMMASRWRHVSDATIAHMLLHEYGTTRPRYGAQLAKAGYLTKHKVPTGYRVDGARQVYSVSKEGYALLAEHEPNIQPARYKPAWSFMQHLLELQMIAAANPNMMVAKSGWLTEPETRMLFDTKDLVPDLSYLERDGAIWIELERTPKNDLRLHHMVVRYAKLLERQEWNKPAMPTGQYLDRVFILVKTPHQLERYRSFFDAPTLNETHLDDSRKIQIGKQEVLVKELLKGRVVITTVEAYQQQAAERAKQPAPQPKKSGWVFGPRGV